MKSISYATANQNEQSIESSRGPTILRGWAQLNDDARLIKNWSNQPIIWDSKPTYKIDIAIHGMSNLNSIYRFIGLVGSMSIIMHFLHHDNIPIFSPMWQPANITQPRAVTPPCHFKQAQIACPQPKEKVRRKTRRPMTTFLSTYFGWEFCIFLIWFSLKLLGDGRLPPGKQGHLPTKSFISYPPNPYK